MVDSITALPWFFARMIMGFFLSPSWIVKQFPHCKLHWPAKSLIPHDNFLLHFLAHPGNGPILFPGHFSTGSDTLHLHYVPWKCPMSNRPFQLPLCKIGTVNSRCHWPVLSRDLQVQRISGKIQSVRGILKCRTYRCQAGTPMPLLPNHYLVTLIEDGIMLVPGVWPLGTSRKMPPPSLSFPVPDSACCRFLPL